MTQVTTSATYKTLVTADLPDFGSRDITFRLVAAFFNAAGEEVIDGTTYTMTLDASGVDDGSFYLPTPDNTGAAGANWFVTLPSGFEDIVTVAYSGAAQAVSDLLAAGSTTTDPDVIVAALAGKQAKDLTATNGYLAIFASGQTVAGAGAPGTAAYAATGDFDAAGAAASAQAAAVQRANHTGTQTAATISDFAATVTGNLQSISSLVTNYTVQASDAGKVLEAATAVSVVLPNGLDTGYKVTIRRTGSAVVSVSATGTLQELAVGTGLSTVAYVEIDTEATLVHRGSNLWLITGDYTATEVWLAGGIASANAIAAYYPVAATDLASSYVNLANPGTYNAAPGTAPSWSAARGWYGAANWYLTTGLSPTVDGTWSALVWYENSLTSSYHNLFGVYQTAGGTGAFGVQISNLNNRMATFNGGISPGYNSPLIGSAFYGFAAKNIYRNGALEPTAVAAGTGTLTQGIYIGAQNANGSPGFYAQADIKALFIYNATLTLAQIEAVGIAIGAISAVTIEDVTYTSSVEA